MGVNEKSLREQQYAWNKSFLDKKFTPEQASREDLEGIASAIGSFFFMAHKGNLNKEILRSLGGYSLEEAEKMYQDALKFYDILNINFSE